jgi:hypothetical protein
VRAHRDLLVDEPVVAAEPLVYDLSA